jgi:hypothetical protein
LAGVAVKLARGRTKSNANLKHDQHVTDEQIREVLASFDTRERQAARLGINERTLRRRLKKK